MEKIAIVTGASKGIGREIAKNLARQNIKVIANYNRSEEKAIKLKEELEKEGIEIDIVKADVSKRQDVKKMIKHTINKYKKIDILINNAGISEYKLFTKEELLQSHLLGYSKEHRKIDDFLGNFIAIAISDTTIILENYLRREIHGEDKKISTHCGLTQDEMEVPIIMFDLK